MNFMVEGGLGGLWEKIVDRVFPEWTAAGRREEALTQAQWDRALRPRIKPTAKEMAEFDVPPATPARLAELAARRAAAEEKVRLQKVHRKFLESVRSNEEIYAGIDNRAQNERAKKIFG